MKKLTLIIALFAIIAISCEREFDPSTHSDKEKFKIEFFAETFRQNLEPMAKRSSGANQIASQNPHGRDWRIKYLVFDEEDRLVMEKGHREYDFYDVDGNFSDDFWKMSFELEKGKYKVGAIYYEDAEDYALTVNDNLNDPPYMVPENTSDVFVAPFFEITVEGDSTYAPTQLKRINGALSVEITDSVKAEAVTLRMSVRYHAEHQIFPFEGQLYDISDEIYYDTWSMFNLKPKVGEINVIAPFGAAFPPNVNADGKFDVFLGLYDSSGELLGSKIVDNVVIRTNYRTKISGPLFDLLTPEGPGPVDTTVSGDFTIDIQEDYSGEDIEIEF